MEKVDETFSWPAILRLVTAGIVIYLAWQLSRTILVIIISMMLASAFYPVVARLQKRMPLPLASILVVIALILPPIIIAISFLPGLIRQVPDILATLDKLINGSGILPPPLQGIDLSQYSQNAGRYILASTS